MNNYAVYNPYNKSLGELPIIYGFNNGGNTGFYIGCLISEDGDFLGSHLCSEESYMLNDLGIIEGSRPDRHERFQEYYPDGYRMEFISLKDVAEHEGLDRAYKLYEQKDGQDGAE